MTAIDDVIEKEAQAFNEKSKADALLGKTDSPTGDSPAGDPSAGDPPKKDPPAGDPPANKPFKDYASKVFEQEFTDDDQARAHVRSLSENQKLLAQLQKDADLLKAQNEELASGLNPKDFFVSDKEMIRQFMLKNNPDVNPEVLSRVASMETVDIDKMDPVECLVTGLLLKENDTFKSKEEAVEFLERKYNCSLTDPNNPPDRATKNLMAMDAKGTRSELKTMKESVKIPERVDLKAAREQRETELKSKQETLKKILKPRFEKFGERMEAIKFTLPNDKGVEEPFFEFAVDDAFKKEINDSVDETVELLAKDGIELTDKQIEELQAKALAKLREQYIVKNANSMMRALKTKLDTDHANKKAVEDHNPRPLNGRQRPAPDSPLAAKHKATEDKIISELGG